MLEYRAIGPQHLCRSIEYGDIAVCGMQAADAHGCHPDSIQNKFLALGSLLRRFHAFTRRQLKVP